MLVGLLPRQYAELRSARQITAIAAEAAQLLLGRLVLD
jgi:hypothetical protein